MLKNKMAVIYGAADFRRKKIADAIHASDCRAEAALDTMDEPPFIPILFF